MPVRTPPGASWPTSRSIAAGVLLLAMIAAWAVAMPLMSSPDEPSHVIRAAAVARGLEGTPGTGPINADEPGVPTHVELPSRLVAVTELTCFRFEETVPADCSAAPVDEVRPGVAIGTTYAGSYPPLYYALVGWPSLVLDGPAAVYAMRLVSALLTGALVLWGISTLVRTTGRSTALWAAAIALTPMCLFLFGTVNPNGLEIASAFAFWAACLGLVRGGPTVRTAVLVQAAVAGALLVLVRTSGPLWAVLIVGVALLCAQPGTLRVLVRSRAVWWAVGVAVVAGVLAAAWIATHGSIVTTSGRSPELAQPRLVVAVMLLSVPALVEQMIGNFGWLDTEAPFPTTDAWVAALAVVLLLGLAVRRARRRRVALLVLLGLLVVVPIALTVPTAEAAGIIWQGRYSLPLAIGVPLVAVPLVVAGWAEVRALVFRLAAVVVVLLGVGHAFAFYWAERRYAEGSEGSWATLHPDWSSPLGFLPIVLVYGLLTVALVVLVVRDVVAPATRPGAPESLVAPVPEPQLSPVAA